MTSLRTYNPVLGEVRDDRGNWHDGCLPFTDLARLIGTTTADLMRRLVMLGVVERQEIRHRLTSTAKRSGYGTTYRCRAKGGKPRLEMDLILPEGMVLVVRNLEATNPPITETERLAEAGLSQRAIAARLGITQQAVHKRLSALPPRLKNWPVLGSWEDREAGDNDNHTGCGVRAA